MYQIRKRDESIVPFEMQKINDAVKRAFESCGRSYIDSIIDTICIRSLAKAEKTIKENVLSVENIRESIEATLVSYGYDDVAKAYKLYKQHDIGKTKTTIDYKKIVENYIKSEDWRVKENASIDYSLGGLILGNSGAITANYWLSEIYDDEIAEAHRNCDIHLHDLSMLSGYCAGWSLKTLIKEGFGGVPKRNSSKPARHLSTICGQMVNFLGTLSLEWSGAQAFNSVDTLLAPFVKVDNLSYLEVKQCIQSLVHSMNIGSRWGCVPEDTEVLTVTGFKKYNELNVGDLIYTWHDGKLEINDVKHVLVKEYSGKLQSYIGIGYEQTVTPEHHVLCKNFNNDEFILRDSKDIFDAETPYSLPVKFKSSALESSNLTDAQIQFAAIVYADGTLDFRNGNIHTVKIFKSDNMSVNDLIKICADELGLEYSVESCKSGFSEYLNTYTFYGDSARYIVELVGNKTKIHERFLNMSSDQSNIFLDTWLKFNNDSEKYMIQYDNDDIRDALQHIALRSGCCTYLVSYSNETNKKPINYISIKCVDTICPTERTETEYSGIVWCPSVENGTAVFRRNGKVFISGQSQPVFSNFTFDWTVPNDLAELNCVVGGKELDFRYKDCKREMDMINKAFLEVMIEGDADGRSFSYPIPTYSITKDFDWDEESINNKLLFEMTAKYGIPYFSNYINSDLDPSSIRSMCPMHKDTYVTVRVNKVIMSDRIEHIYEMFGENLIDVLTPNGWRKGKPIKVDNQKTYKITMKNGLSVSLGENHLQPTKDNGTLLTKDLKVGMSIPYVDKQHLDVFLVTDDIKKIKIKYSEIESIEQIEYNDILYCFEIDDENHLFILCNGIVTHNCRLRLDLRELRRKNGGYFGSGDNTGSIQVCTINLPRLAYKSDTREQFFNGLEHLMNICARATDIKRKAITKYLEQGLYPYTKRYLKSFDDHFSTIGVIGMNECCINASWIDGDISSKNGYEFAKEVLDFILSKLPDYQEKYNCLFNLEASPAEGVTYRFASHDKKDFPNIVTAGDITGGSPYYTNSSHLPVGYTDDIFEALDHQDELQAKYTSGTVFHAFLGERLPNWKSAMLLTKKIAENYRLPYFTFSPTYSICKNHGYLVGEQWKCPHCGEATEVYSRITGYYRAVQNFNDGKRQEFEDRKEYVFDSNVIENVTKEKQIASPETTDTHTTINISELKTKKPILVTTETCPNCKIVKKYIEETGFECSVILASENKEFVQGLGIEQAPTLVIFDDNNNAKFIANTSNIRKYVEEHMS